MSWNYRLVKIRADDGLPYYEVREVHYDVHGVPWGMSEGAVTFGADPIGGDEVEAQLEVAQALSAALHNVLSKPVFNPPTTWPGINPDQPPVIRPEDTP